MGSSFSRWISPKTQILKSGHDALNVRLVSGSAVHRRNTKSHDIGYEEEGGGGVVVGRQQLDLNGLLCNLSWDLRMVKKIIPSSST